MKREDLTGKRYNHWEVVGLSHIENGKAMFRCICDCGNKRVIVGTTVKNGRSKSCGCERNKKNKYKGIRDFTGERIGRLTVICLTEPKNYTLSSRHRRWKVVCDCGKTTFILPQTIRSHIRGGHGSCGCWSAERNREERKKKTKPYSFYLNRIKTSVRGRNKNRKAGKIILTLTYKDIIEIIPKGGVGNCVYCGKRIYWDKYDSKAKKERHSGHNFDRKDNDRGYEKGNIVTCCGDCNRTRGDRFTYEEFLLLSPILKIINNNRKKHVKN